MTSITFRLPNGETQWAFRESVPVLGDTIHIAGGNWTVAAVQEDGDGRHVVVLAPAQVLTQQT
jgi:hypothetical protein